MVYQLTKKNSRDNRLSQAEKIVNYSIQQLSSMIDSCSEIKNDDHRQYIINKLESEINNIEKTLLQYLNR